MKENKELYYTPKLEDIKVGYQCETKVEPYLNWVFTKIEDGDDINYIKDNEWQIRTKYLSKEDIESEGWTYIPDRNYEENSAFKHHKDNYEVIFWTHFNRLLVKNFRYGVVLFENAVKKDMSKHQISINEFRYITKELLGII